MRAVRKNIPDKEEKSRRIFERVRSLPDYRKAAGIGVYVSTPDEVSTEKIIEDALKSGKTAAVPRITRSIPESRYFLTVSILRIPPPISQNNPLSFFIFKTVS